MAVSIKDGLARKNSGRPLKSYLWAVRLPNLSTNNIGGQDASSAMRKAMGNFRRNPLGTDSIVLENIHHRVHSISMPFETFGTRNVAEGNHRWMSIDRKELAEFTMEIQEYEDMQTLKYLHQWIAMIQNTDGTFNPPAFWKHDIVVYRLSSVNHMHVSKHTYKNAALTSINDVSADYESSEIARYNVNFSVDNVEHVAVNIENKISMKENQILKNRINFAYDDPANVRDYLQAGPVDDAFNVFDNVIDRVPGL